MPTYTVHAPPLREGGIDDPERFVFVRDGFHFWAFVLPPVWLIVHGLWLALIGFIVIDVVVTVGLSLLGAGNSAGIAVGVLLGLLVGFEAPTLWRWTLARNKRRMLGFVVADDAEGAERRFYAQWVARPPERTMPAPSQSYTAPVRRGPPSGHDVIGLFPEPGTPR